jgi:hypothetical protein
MNNIKSILFLFALSALIVSCGDSEFDVYDGVNKVHFIESEGTYFVQETEDPGFNVELGAYKPSDGNLNANVVIIDSLSTAEEGTHYNLSSTTANFGDGEVIASIMVEGVFDNLADSKTLTFKLEGDENVANYDTMFTLNLTQFCPYIQDEFVGTYIFQSAAFGATYDVEIVAGSSPDELIAQNLYADGFNVSIQMDDSDPASFQANVTKQDAWVSADFGQARVEGSGPFNACEKTIVLNLEHTVDAGTFGTFEEVLIKK